MVVNTRVRGTSPTVMCDVEVQHQGYRTRLTLEVTTQLDVPTSLTPAPSHMLCFYFEGCVKEVRKLINHPVVSLFGTRVGGTGVNMITENIDNKLCATTSRERKLRQGRYCCTDTWENPRESRTPAFSSADFVWNRRKTKERSPFRS